MEHWRAFFGKSNSDIWTIIEQAINLAAVDHPDVFKEKRVVIAEALFARRLVQIMPAKDDFASVRATANDEQLTSSMEEGELKDDYEEKCVTTCQDDGAQSLRLCYDEAQALHDDEDQEAAIIEEINAIKQALKKDNQSESILLELLLKLEDLEITVSALKITEIGKHVNCLRKHPSKYIQVVVKRLVKHWKFLIDEWVKTSGGASVVAATRPVASAGSPFRDEPEFAKRLQISLSPPVDEALSYTAEEDLLGKQTQLFSSIDGDICGQVERSGNPLDSIDHSAKGSAHNSCSRSQSGSGLTYASDCDARASTSQAWGLLTPREMRSATRDVHISERIEKVSEQVSRGLLTRSDMDQRGPNYPSDLQFLSKTVTKNLDEPRTSNDVSQTIVASCSGAAGKLINDSFNLNRNALTQNSSVLYSSERERMVQPSTINKSADKRNQVEQKLEIAKRKLHQGYQQAGNAKKQRAVQVLDFPDLPKASEIWGKVNSAVQSEVGPQGSHWG